MLSNVKAGEQNFGEQDTFPEINKEFIYERRKHFRLNE